VISFELAWNHPEEDLQKAFNALLPRDVSALEVVETGEDFHPRFDARFRRYRYSLRVNEHRDQKVPQ
jgi:tRNA pseudouridine38-40 synthase